MKNEMKALTRAEMKKIAGGGGFFIWNCTDITGLLRAQQCSVLNPYLRCGYYACSVTTTICAYSGCS